MFVPDIIPHLGRYCEVTTRSGRFFGELIRLSAALFMVRSSWPAVRAAPTIEADEIEAITDLANPRL
ncbi:MAG: hypothetical protein WAL67_10480 [Candidatus Cybelea sp.]